MEVGSVMQIKILVVDDSASDRLIIRNMLSDYCVLTACDGVEAMRMLEEHDGINLIVLDLKMPNMDGFQVLEALDGDKRFSKVRTIILTNYDEPENEIRGLKSGAVDFVRKPIQMHTLRVRIDVHAALLRAQQALEQQLAQQTLSFDMIFDQAPIGIAISHCCGPDNSEDIIVRVNHAYEQIIGRTKEEIVDLGWMRITHPDDVEEDMENLRRLRSGEVKVYSMDKRYIRPDGSVVWVHTVVAPLVSPDNQQYGHICLVQDITGRKSMEEALNESERSKSVLLSNLPGLAYRCNYDRDWTMQYVSQGCLDLTGYPPESLLNNRDISFNEVISPEYRETLWDEWHRILANRQPFKFEYEIITAAGEKKWVLEMGQGIYNDNGEVEALEGIILDISDRKAMENALKYNYEHDKWTGLHNRDYLVSLLEKDLRQGEKVKRALIGINLRTVGLLTANYGFQYTQNLIKKAAEALSEYCTDKRMLFNTYQNRFLFYVVDYKDKNELIEFSRTIADLLESIFFVERISGGIGILEIRQDEGDADADMLLRRLLIASERAVSMFGRVFEIRFYDDELEALVNRERDISIALSNIAANEQTNDKLYLQYQPIMDLKTGSIIGFEALARLRTEKFGNVSPLEFIPIAEKTKLIIPLGEKVTEQAFRFSNRLRECGYEDISVSINISAIQILNPDFIGRLLELMERMRIDPKNIGVEITESVFASDYEYINNSIDKLRKAGVYIAIDDFGTGYSSLARERELRVDCMKIDKHFIDRLLCTDPKKAITGDIISMSHKLGHFTIAEGVEQEIQLRYLKEHDCDKVQGYLISRPLDEDDAIEFLRKLV